MRGGGDRGSLSYRYQLIRYQVPPKLKVLVPSILGEGAVMNVTNSERRSTSVPGETNGQDQTTPLARHRGICVTLCTVKAKNLFQEF